MGRLLTNKTNVDNTNADFPRGRIKDDDGTQSGTPVNEEVYGDAHQAIEQANLYAETYEPDSQFNGQPDSDEAGYQVAESLRKMQPYASLYREGRFLSVGTNFAGVDTIVDCCVYNNYIYVADSGGDVVSVFNIHTGVKLLDIGAGSINTIGNIQVIPGGVSGEDVLLYVLSQSDNEIRVFGGISGTYLNALDITASLTTPISFAIDWFNDRIYTYDSTSNSAIADDILVLPHRDRILVLDTAGSRYYSYQIDGTAVAGEDKSGLSTPTKFHAIGVRVYVNESSGIKVYRRYDGAAVPEQDVPTAIMGAATSFFIRHGVLYICDLGTHDILPITCVNPQEYQ